jgi:DNA invertase Pin-like site-specific DNA recombinase
MARLVAYVRVSKTNKRTGPRFQSPDEQRRAINNIVALTPSAEVVEWIEEYDESGGTMDRPGAKRAIAAVANGTADGVVMAYLSRWARTPEALEQIEAWGKEGKMFLSAAERIDTTTSHGMFALGVLLLVAKLELDRHSENWGNSTRNAIERGVAIRVPYGYKRGPEGRLVPDEPAASIVRRMFRLRAAGHAVAQIAHQLDAEGARPPATAHWTRQTVRAMLRVRTYLGEAKYGQHVTVDAHPALIDRVTWQAAQTERAARWQPGKHLLTGMVRCAGCGYIMGASQGRGGTRYSCGRHTASGTCPSPTAALATVIEPFVVARFLDRYGEAAATVAQTTPELALLEGALTRARAEFEAWRDDGTMRAVVGDENYRAGLIARHAAVADAEAAHDAAAREASASTLSIDAGAWDELTIVERRELLRAGIDDIVLSRAGVTGTHAPIAGRCVVRFVGEREPADLPRQGSPRRSVR